MAGIIVVNDGGTWKSPNFHGNTVWIKDTADSTWKEPLFVYVKKPTTGWTQVWPSDTETTSSAELPVDATRITVSSYVPNLDTDVSYPYTNIKTAGQEVRWKDRTGPTGLGEYVSGQNFNWTIPDDTGFGFGAISYVKVTFNARYVDLGGYTYRVRAFIPPLDYTGKLTAPLTSGFTTYTLEGTPSAWGVGGDSRLDRIYDYTGRSTTGNVAVVPLYDNAAAGSDQRVAIKDVNVTIKYLTN